MSEKGKEFFVARRRNAARIGGLFVSTGSRIHHRPVVDRCKVPTPEGPCNHPFFEDEPRSKIEAHIVKCLERNQATIMETRARQHPKIMEPWDPEFAKWTKAHKDAILEGRLRI